MSDDDFASWIAFFQLKDEHELSRWKAMMGQQE